MSTFNGPLVILKGKSSLHEITRGSGGGVAGKEGAPYLKVGLQPVVVRTCMVISLINDL